MMSGDYKLTEGVLETIINGGNVLGPIVQVLGSKKMSAATGGSSNSDRYRLLLSDGKFKVKIALFKIPGNNKEMIEAIENYSIIKLNRYLSNVINNRDRKTTRVLLILELELLVKGDAVRHVIGDPQDLEFEMSSSQTSSFSGGSPDITRRSGTLTKSDLSGSQISPIASLNPFHNNWVIRARVVNKTKIRNWTNSKGEGKLFSVDLVDKGGEIKCTAFRELVDKFFDKLEVDKVYYFNNCVLKPINKQFCPLNHEYEMVFTHTTEIQESTNDNETVPHMKYNFVSLDKVATMPAGTTVDVIGVCKSASDLHIFTSKSTNRELKKRELLLVDQSKTGIVLTLWDNNAESFVMTANPIVAIKNAKIGEFVGTKNLNLRMTSQLKINPNVPETNKLRNWYDFDGITTDFKNISARFSIVGQFPWMSFKEANSQDMSQNLGSFSFQTLGTILLVRLDRAVYKACPSTDCQKKVIDLENGMYRCEKCNREYRSFKYRLLLSMNISDCSSNQWVTVFSSEAEKILGKTAQEIGEAMEADQDGVAKLFEDTQFKEYIFKCRTRVDNYNDEQKLRVIVVEVKPVCFEEHNAYLIRKIEELSGVLPD